MYVVVNEKGSMPKVFATPSSLKENWIKVTTMPEKLPDLQIFQNAIVRKNDVHC